MAASNDYHDCASELARMTDVHFCDNGGEEMCVDESFSSFEGSESEGSYYENNETNEFPEGSDRKGEEETTESGNSEEEGVMLLENLSTSLIRARQAPEKLGKCKSSIFHETPNALIEKRVSLEAISKCLSDGVFSVIYGKSIARWNSCLMKTNAERCGDRKKFPLCIRNTRATPKDRENFRERAKEERRIERGNRLRKATILSLKDLMSLFSTCKELKEKTFVGGFFEGILATTRWKASSFYPPVSYPPTTNSVASRFNRSVPFNEEKDKDKTDAEPLSADSAYRAILDVLLGTTDDLINRRQCAFLDGMSKCKISEYALVPVKCSVDPSGWLSLHASDTSSFDIKESASKIMYWEEPTLKLLVQRNKELEKKARAVLAREDSSALFGNSRTQNDARRINDAKESRPDNRSEEV